MRSRQPSAGTTGSLRAGGGSNRRWAHPSAPQATDLRIELTPRGTLKPLAPRELPCLGDKGLLQDRRVSGHLVCVVVVVPFADELQGRLVEDPFAAALAIG